ncbi:MAG: hypothetical protein H0X38_12280 [Planctomycetes bacterium]|nr:hypothetical protein [Planctomycetota bacterium]
MGAQQRAWHHGHRLAREMRLALREIGNATGPYGYLAATPRLRRIPLRLRAAVLARCGRASV